MDYEYGFDYGGPTPLQVPPRPMTADEVRRLAYDALTEMDELLDEYEADEEPCRELVSIRAKLFQLAGGVVWEDMQPKEEVTDGQAR